MAAIQLFYYLFFYVRLAFAKNKKLNKTQVPVSVIICAKNEAENLKNYLPLILEQDYPNFEVVVVNDGSYDDTEFILKYLEEKYKHLRHTNIKENKFRKGKKLALTIGVKSAKHEHLLLTDADTYPSSKNWIKNIMSQYDDNTQIVLSYGAFEKENSFLNKLIRFDNFFNSMQYLSFAKAGIPYMGTGRNLSYLKSLFVENRGFASHYGIASGDDDLFVNENANKENTNVCLDTEAFTYSPAKKTFADWLFQKQRHLTTSPRYKLKHKFLLSLEPFSRILLLASFIASIFYNCYTGMAIFGFVLLTKLIVLNFAQKTLKEKDLFLFSLLFDIILPVLYLILHIKKLIKQQEWK